MEFFLNCGITGDTSAKFHQRLQLILQGVGVNDKEEEANGLTDKEGKMKNRIKKQRISKKLITEH